MRVYHTKSKNYHKKRISLLNPSKQKNPSNPHKYAVVYDTTISQKKSKIYDTTLSELENQHTNKKEIQKSLDRFVSDYKPLGKGIDSIRFRYSKKEAKKAYAIAKAHDFKRVEKGVFAKSGIYLKLQRERIELYNLKQFNQSKEREYRELSKSQKQAIQELLTRLKVIEIDLAFDIETSHAPSTLAKRVSKAQSIRDKATFKKRLFSKEYTISKHHSTRYLKPRSAKNGIKQVCIYNKRAKNNLAFNCVRVEYTISATHSKAPHRKQSEPRMRFCFDDKRVMIIESVEVFVREQKAPP